MKAIDAADEDADWRQAAAEGFFRDDADGDVVYDELSTSASVTGRRTSYADPGVDRAGGSERLPRERM
jgi:hypothetical protein